MPQPIATNYYTENKRFADDYERFSDLIFRKGTNGIKREL
jgi:hypothetical protein